MSNIVLSQLDDQFLAALQKFEVMPISVQVKESQNRDTFGKKLYQVFLSDTMMDYEVKAIEEQGFKLMWATVSRLFAKLDCCLEMTFKEQ